MSDRDRADLDKYVALLAQAGDGLTIDDFRERVIQRAVLWERNARLTLYAFGLVFMAAVIYEFSVPSRLGDSSWTLVWAISLGGLGAVASILLNILKLAPQDAAQTSEELEVVARIFLGCLFSLVLSLALISEPLREFHHLIGGERAPGAPEPPQSANLIILLPFLCGYSIRLVLGILTKAILAVEMTLGLNEMRPARRGRARRGTAANSGP